MKRKEVYATTGTRITVRMFGGWGFKPGDDQRSDYVTLGYEKGVPMGGELHRDPTAASQTYRGLAAAEAEQAHAPTSLVVAMKDPINGNLDRVQMIKGWLDSDGELQERVYNIAWGDAEERTLDSNGKIPPVGNTVDLASATWANTIGASERATVCTDPDFDPAASAFYYARVLEIPTPPWYAYDAFRFGIDLPEGAPTSQQERAYTSPIWYSPQRP